MGAAWCAHCGLPVYGGRRRRAEDGEIYCCIGCAIVASALGKAKGDETGAETKRFRVLMLRVGLAAFFSANIMVLTLFLYSLERGADAEVAPPAATALIRGLLACFSLPVFAILAPPFLRGLVKDARRLRFSMDSLIAVGAGTAFLYSCVSVARNEGEVYFDTAVMVMLLVTVGRLLEANARVRGRRALKELLELQPPRARVWREGAWEMLEAAAVQAGDRVRVLAGERIPVDGRIEKGAAAIDESMLTGEPLPAERQEGETVRAGSLCLNGTLEITCLEAAGGSLLARIVSAVEEAQRLRSPAERLADRVAAALVPLTVALAAAVVLYWWRDGPERGLLNGLSVLVVACPCAVGIAIPMTNVIALAGAARRGILVRSSEALERLAGIKTIVLDKTGTVTSGRIQVKRVMSLGSEDEQGVLAAAAACATGSLHPVARAIEEEARRRGVKPETPRRTEELPGRGVRAELEGGRRLALGHPRWLEHEVRDAPAAWRRITEEGSDSAHGSAWCAEGERLLGAVLFEDPPRPEAAATAAELQGMGYRLTILSGDRPEVVAAAARSLHIDKAEGGLLPEEKAERVRQMIRGGKRAAMVGDGINDAPALAAAEVGIAVSNSTDTAREVAEVVLVEGEVHKLAELMRLARRARRTGRQNLAWTFFYNSFALSLAAAGWLKPIWAATIMLASSILVVTNALRLAARTRGAANHGVFRRNVYVSKSKSNSLRPGFGGAE